MSGRTQLAPSGTSTRALDAPDNRPVVRLAAGNIARIVDEAEAALVAAGLGFYQRGAFIVRSATMRITVSDQGAKTVKTYAASSTRWTMPDSRFVRPVP
jgi:hypothetical protein